MRRESTAPEVREPDAIVAAAGELPRALQLRGSAAGATRAQRTWVLDACSPISQSFSMVLSEPCEMTSSDIRGAAAAAPIPRVMEPAGTRGTERGRAGRRRRH